MEIFIAIYLLSVFLCCVYGVIYHTHYLKSDVCIADLFVIVVISLFPMVNLIPIVIGIQSVHGDFLTKTPIFKAKK